MKYHASIYIYLSYLRRRKSFIFEQRVFLRRHRGKNKYENLVGDVCLRSRPMTSYAPLSVEKGPRERFRNVVSRILNFVAGCELYPRGRVERFPLLA